MALARGQEGGGVRQTGAAASRGAVAAEPITKARPGLLQVPFGAVEAVDGDLCPVIRRAEACAIRSA